MHYSCQLGQTTSVCFFEHEVIFLASRTFVTQGQRGGSALFVAGALQGVVSSRSRTSTRRASFVFNLIDGVHSSISVACVFLLAIYK